VRFWHWVTYHRWHIVSCVFTPPRPVTWTNLHGTADMSNDMQKLTYGFTEIAEHCICGARRYVTFVGDHSGIRSAGEVADLERLMR
jgi:hypothetical protein